MEDTMTSEEYLRLNVAEALRYVATQVEQGNVIKLKFEWDGGKDVESTLTLSKPMKFVSIPIDLAGTTLRGSGEYE